MMTFRMAPRLTMHAYTLVPTWHSGYGPWRSTISCEIWGCINVQGKLPWWIHLIHTSTSDGNFIVKNQNGNWGHRHDSSHLLPYFWWHAAITVPNEVLQRQQDGHIICYNLMYMSDEDAMEGIPKDSAVSEDASMANTIASIHMLSCRYSPSISR